MHSARLSGTIQSNTLGLATMVTQISSATQELAAVSESFKQISGEMSIHDRYRVSHYIHH